MIVKLAEEKKTLDIPGEDLLTRPVAKKFVRPLMLYFNESLKKVEALEISFDQVKTADSSFIDELLVRNLFVPMSQDKLKSGGVFLSHLSPSTYDNSRSVFIEKKIPVLVKTAESHFDVLGRLEDNLAETLNYLMSRKITKAVELQRRADIPLNVASTRLHRLNKFGLATRKEEITEKGREFVYYSLF